MAEDDAGDSESGGGTDLSGEGAQQKAPAYEAPIKAKLLFKVMTYPMLYCAHNKEKGRI